MGAIPVGMAVLQCGCYGEKDAVTPEEMPSLPSVHNGQRDGSLPAFSKEPIGINRGGNPGGCGGGILWMVWELHPAYSPTGTRINS